MVSRVVGRAAVGGMAVVVMLALGAPVAAQQTFATGQNIAPAYEGWEQNDDGSFNLIFGYMNRNWEQVFDIPVGPDNTLEPGGPDLGQPTHFQPRRNRFVFRVRVPADFGDKEVVWTLTSNGRTERAYGTLKADYFIDDLVVQANYGAAGAAGTTPELPSNRPPALLVGGGATRTVSVGHPVTLTAVVTDDGKPRARPLQRALASRPGSITTDSATGLRFSWSVYRGTGESVRFEPPQIKVWEDTRPGGDSPWSPAFETPAPQPTVGGGSRRRLPSQARSSCVALRTMGDWPPFAMSRSSSRILNEGSVWTVSGAVATFPPAPDTV